jgi:N-acylneuraminate cytidylyltransferase
MKYIIPAKTNSLRVVNKNFREFHQGQSLVDIVIQKLLATDVDSSDIFLSTDSEDIGREKQDLWSINFIKRDESLCDNSVPLTTWIREIAGQVTKDEDVAWCQVCDPMFNEYKTCFDLWREARKTHDSLVVCYPWSGYLMTDNSMPVGWCFGEHHTPSQDLPKLRTMPFTLSILSQESIKSTGYHVGKRPIWYESKSLHIDIDTEEDFQIAQLYYKG